MRIRSATVDDLPQIMALELRGFRPGTLESESVFRQRLEAFPDGFLVAEAEDNVLLGYISSELWPYAAIPDESSFVLGHSISRIHSPRNEELYVSSMTVDPVTRGTGLGRQLFGECIDRCMHRYPHVRSAILLVSESWTHARRIYERFGFREIMRLPGFFRPDNTPPVDGIVMRKELRVG